MVRKAEKIAHESRLACEKWREYFKYNIDKYHLMHTFVLGQQWEQREEDDMIKTYRKVPMTANKLPALANSLLGEQQQNTPQLQVVPMTNCDERTAHLRELIVKDIMFSTDAVIAYQVSSRQAAIGGFGVFFVGTDYTHKNSFDLNIIYGYFKDSTRTYFDMSAEKQNKTDGMYCGYITRMSREKFRETYGKELEEKVSKSMSPTQSKEDIALAVEPSEGDDPFTWADNEGITILNHFKRKFKNDTLYKLSNSKNYNQEELDELIEKSRNMNERLKEERRQMNMMQQTQGMGTPQETEDQSPPSNAEPQEEIPEESNQEFDTDTMTLWDDGNPVRIEDKKTVKLCKIWHYKIAGDYILEEEEFPTDEHLPMVFNSPSSYYDKNGKQICIGYFDDCKDIQRYINYIRTQSAYILKTSRYDQFMLSKKNVQSLDTQQAWRDPTAMKGGIPYDESPNGNKPEQLRPPELSASLPQQYEMAIQDLYLATGLYPSQLGQQGNEISGDAIDSRNRQGSYATYCFRNAINRAITTSGSIVNEMIPRVYDSERVISLMMPDEGMKNITINKQRDAYGELIENDIRKGTYEVRLIAGPSYEGQKAEALRSLREVLQVDPETFKIVADLYADNLPLANNLEIKNRLKTLVPPQIIEAGKTGKMPSDNGQHQPDPQAMAMQAEMQLKSKEIELKEKELELKKQEIMMEAQFKIQELENERLETAAAIKEQELRYAAETQRTASDQQIAHADNLIKILTHSPKLNK